jgi:DnaJ-class molecular chaperone
MLIDNSRVLISTVFLIVASLSVCSGGGDFNPYDVLGVARNADERSIKSAYRKLAKHWHPDKNSAANAQEKFMRINEAYSILSDADSRSLYDDYGVTNKQKHGGGGGGGGYRRENYGYHDPFEGFESFFSGHDNRFRKERARKNPEEEVSKK